MEIQLEPRTVAPLSLHRPPGAQSHLHTCLAEDTHTSGTHLISYLPTGEVTLLPLASGHNVIDLLSWKIPRWLAFSRGTIRYTPSVLSLLPHAAHIPARVAIPLGGIKNPLGAALLPLEVVPRLFALQTYFLHWGPAPGSDVSQKPSGIVQRKEEWDRTLQTYTSDTLTREKEWRELLSSGILPCTSACLLFILILLN